MSAHDVLPLITVSMGLVALVLGFLILSLEHSGSPFLQRASTGILMLGLLVTIDEACRCAIAQTHFDWRLMLFAVGLAGAWGYRVFSHFSKRGRR